MEEVKSNNLANILLYLVAFGEAALGLLLLLYPPIVIKLLFNAQILDISLIISRVFGISLIALGFACWPQKFLENNINLLRAMLIYNLFVAIYLGYQGLISKWVGILLWPAVILHFVLALLLGWQLLKAVTISRS